jgi:hypothetical protein
VPSLAVPEHHAVARVLILGKRFEENRSAETARGSAGAARPEHAPDAETGVARDGVNVIGFDALAVLDLSHGQRRDG